MNKLVIVSAILAAFVGMNTAQAVSTGTITFNGELTASTCDVVVDGQTANANVTLPTVGTNQLTAANMKAGKTGCSMALKNCSGTLKTASAFFEAGPTVDLVTGHLKNATGTASLVDLELLDGSNNFAAIKAGSGSQVTSTSYVNVATSSATLPYAVQYNALGASTAGTVKSSIVYSVQYK